MEEQKLAQISMLSHWAGFTLLYLGQWIYEVMDVGILGGLDDLTHGHLTAVVSVRDVFSDAAVEESWFLWDDSYLTSQPMDIQLREVVAFNSLE